LSIDPITLEVVRNYLQRVSEEMEATVIRTAHSIAIYDSKDFVCGVLDSEPSLLSASLGTPIFPNALPNAVRTTYEIIGKEHLDPEDVIICNDPYYGGGTHGNDVVALYPVFLDGKPIAFTGFKGHVLDIGGSKPSGYYNNTTEIFQELFRIPPVKLYRKGELNEEVARLILINNRLPDELMGDFRAMVAALKTGGKRIRDLVSKYSYAKFVEYTQELLNQSEKFARNKISHLPEGRYEGEYFLDGDGDDNQPISRRLKVSMKVLIKNGELTIDLSESSPQSPGPMNSAKANSISFAKFAYKSLVDPFSPVNDGTFRPLKVILKNGTIFDPISPAPVALWIETAQGLIDLLFKVLSTAAPDKVRGSTFGSDVVNFIYGTDPRNKRFYVIVDTLQGGWGGNPDSDGATLYATSEGNSTYPMTEMLEANYPLLVHRWELIQDSCGAGKFRGGLGVRRDYEMLSSAHITACYDRHLYSPPWGVLNGGEASTNYLIINSIRGTSEEHTKITDYPLDRGDVISFRTGGGGGYGNPLERNLNDVLKDVHLGYISEVKARQDYGLAIDKNGAILQEETRQLRESMSKKRS